MYFFILCGIIALGLLIYAGYELLVALEFMPRLYLDARCTCDREKVRKKAGFDEENVDELHFLSCDALDLKSLFPEKKKRFGIFYPMVRK